MSSDSPTIDADQSLEQRLSALGRDLSRTFSELFEALPGSPTRPMDIARALGLNKDAASRLVKAVRQADAMAAVHEAPGPDPLMRAVAAAAKQDLPPEVVEAAREVVARFDRIIRAEAGDRATLDTMISAFLPEAREKQELAAKQLAFRGMTLIKGVSAETNLSTTIVHPSQEDPERVDLAMLLGTFGLRRIHPRASVRLGSALLSKAVRARRLTLDGDPVESLETLRLDEFCSRPLIDLEPRFFDDRIQYSLGSGAVGSSAAANVLIAEYQPASMMRAATGGAGRNAQFSLRITYPLRRILFDILLHRDVFTGSQPWITVHDTVPGGLVSIDDPLREVDVLQMTEHVRSCGRGIECLRAAEIPRYVEVLHHVCGKLGWNPAEFRGYRCAIDYPVHGSQISMLFPREGG